MYTFDSTKKRALRYNMTSKCPNIGSEQMLGLSNAPPFVENKICILLAISVDVNQTVRLVIDTTP